MNTSTPVTEFKWDDDLVKRFVHEMILAPGDHLHKLLTDRLEYFKKQHPEPLFITEDGKKIFIDDQFWWVGRQTFIIGWSKAHAFTSYAKGYFESYITFGNEQSAREYVLMNKPCLSAQEVIELWKGEDYLPTQIKILAQSKITP
jgi:hypothetical protein